MAGPLDEISLAIGGLKADIRSMTRSLDQDRDRADERHRENLEKLECLDHRVGKIEIKMETTVAPLAATVSDMKPIVDSLSLTRSKMFFVASGFGGAILLGVWLIEQAWKVLELAFGKH
jgi:hypothetical protein